MTRALALSVLFAACALLTPGDSLFAQPPPAPGTVNWAPGYPGTFDPIGPPFPKQGGVIVYGTFSAPAGEWMVGPAGLFYKLQAGGVTYSAPLKTKDGAFGGIDPQTGKSTPAYVDIGKGDWAVWVNVVYSRINPVTMKEVIVPVSSSYKNVSVK